MILSRRSFLKSVGVGLTALALPPGLARAAGSVSQRKLLFVFLRGGADGLNLMFPRGGVDGNGESSEAHYQMVRAALFRAANPAYDAGGGWEFHPELVGADPASRLLPLYQSGNLAVIHAVNAPGASHSHFAAQDGVERTSPRDATATRGWLHRTLEVYGMCGLRPESDPLASLGGVGLNTALPLSLAGPLNPRTTNFRSIANHVLTSATGGSPSERQAAIEALYAGVDPTTPIAAAGRSAFGALTELSTYRLSSEAGLPFRNAARLLMNWQVGATPPSPAQVVQMGPPGPGEVLDLGVRAVTVDLGGWDHHSSETPQMTARAAGLADGLRSFWNDLTPEWREEILVIAISEFGRTVDANGNAGTDHGAGGVCFVMGGSSLAGGLGGQVFSQGEGLPSDYTMGSYAFPSLIRPPASMFRRDLPATTDFRDIFAEVIDKHLGFDPAVIIPAHDDADDNYDYSVNSANYIGLLGGTPPASCMV